MRRRSILVGLSLLLAAATARAEDTDQAKDVARRYAEEGIALHERGDYAGAVQSFTRAYGVLGAPTVGIRLARSQAKLGHLVEAAEAYRAVIATPVKKTDPPVFAQAVTDARAELEALTPRIPTLTITLADGVTSPRLDENPVTDDALGQPVPLNPGTHRVGGLGAAPKALEIHEGERATLQLEAAASAATQSGPGRDWRRIAGISSAGLAGVSLVVGVVGSLQVNAARSDSAFVAYTKSTVTNDACVSAAPGGDRPNSMVKDICSKAYTGVALQAIFYPAAVVLGGVGTYLILTSGKGSSPRPAQVQLLPHFGPRAGGLDVIGTF